MRAMGSLWFVLRYHPFDGPEFHMGPEVNHRNWLCAGVIAAVEDTRWGQAGYTMKSKGEIYDVPQ